MIKEKDKLALALNKRNFNYVHRHLRLCPPPSFTIDHRFRHCLPLIMLPSVFSPTTISDDVHRRLRSPSPTMSTAVHHLCHHLRFCPPPSLLPFALSSTPVSVIVHFLLPSVFSSTTVFDDVHCRLRSPSQTMSTAVHRLRHHMCYCPPLSLLPSAFSSTTVSDYVHRLCYRLRFCPPPSLTSSSFSSTTVSDYVRRCLVPRRPPLLSTVDNHHR